MEAEVHVGRPVLAQVNVAVDLDVRLFELGLSGNSQFRSLGDRVNGELAGALLVEGKVVEVNGGIERWLFQRARAIRDEVPSTGYGDASALQHGYAGQIKIVPRKVKAKSMTGWIVAGAAGHIRFVVLQLNIPQFSFLSIEVQVRTKTLNRFAVNTAIAQQDVALPLRGRAGSRHLQVQVYGPGDRVGVPCQGKNARQIGILSIQACLYRAGVAELTLVKLHMKIELDRVWITVQRSVAHGKDRG